MSENTFRAIRTEPCVVCNERTVLLVPVEGYKRWLAGMPIQHAMPHVPADVREIIVSGTHPECLAKITGGEQ